MDFERSEKYIRILSEMPNDLKPIYRQLVAEYVYHTQVKYGRGYVAYEVLAELVKAGWAPPEGTVKESGG